MRCEAMQCCAAVNNSSACSGTVSVRNGSGPVDGICVQTECARKEGLVAALPNMLMVGRDGRAHERRLLRAVWGDGEGGVRPV